MDEFSFSDSNDFDLAEGHASAQSDSSSQLIELPDGTDALLLGNPEAGRDYFHEQGENDYGFDGDCGLTSCGDVLNQFGEKVSENDLVKTAIEQGFCEVVPGQPELSGGTSLSDQVQVLDMFGVPSHIEALGSLEGLAEKVGEGHGVIMEVNAGELWGDKNYYENGQSNHAVTVTNVAIDPATGAVKGICIDDSGAGEYHRWLPPDHPALQNWQDNGSPSVVTDLQRP